MILILFVGVRVCHSQLKFNVNVSDKHLHKVEKGKNAKAKLQSYKKYYSKDSLKAAKQAWKDYKKKNKDSLKTEGRWKEAKENQKKVLTGEWEAYKKKAERYKLDSASLPKPKDSLDWALRELAIQGEYEQIQKMYREYAQYDSAHLKQFKLDSMKLDSAQLQERFQMKERLQSYMPEELAQETDTDVANQLKSGVIDEFGNIKQVDRSGVKEFFQKVSPEEFGKAQLDMKVLKEKYTKLPDLSKEEDGIKRKSLEGSPWKKRVFLGGHVTIQSTDPVILDSDIRVGYRFNKSISAGTGFIFREQFNRRTTDLTGDAHGYSIFTSYEFANSYFLYGEYQTVKNQSLFSETVTTGTWENAYLAGAGRRFTITKRLSGSVSLLYDFNFKNNNLNSRPLMIRFGYQVDLQ